MNERFSEQGQPLRAAAAAAGARVDDKLGDVWWALLARGLVLAALAVFVFFWPSTGLAVVARIVGAFLIVDGAAGLLGAISAQDRGPLLVQGALSLIVGAVLLLWPSATERTLMLTLGAWGVLQGLGLLWQSRELAPDSPNRSAVRTVGLVLAVIGFVLLVWPGAGVVTLAWVIAAAALVASALLLWLSRKVKRVRKALPGQ